MLSVPGIAPCSALDRSRLFVLGLKARHRRLFEDVTWSTDQVAEQTLARAAESGFSSICCRHGTMSTTRNH